MFEDRPERDAEVVLTGRSNVGKSTIMRAFTGHAFETGGSPGVTRAPNFYDWTGPDFLLTDLPGFGFMEGVEDDRREAIKTDIVRYLEANANAILAGVVVVDGKAVIDIVDRHREAGEVPHVIDLYAMLEDVGVAPIVAVNKMDKVDDRDGRLDAVADRFGLPGPWQQWRDRVAPITAKRGDIAALREALRTRFEAAQREELLGYVV